MASRPHQKRPHQFLLRKPASEQRIAEKRLEEILTALANTPDWPLVGEKSDFDRNVKAIEYYRSRYPEIFNEQESILDVIALRDLVRKAWRARDDHRSAQWYLFQVRQLHAKTWLVKQITDPTVLKARLNTQKFSDTDEDTDEVRTARWVYKRYLEARRMVKEKKFVAARAALAFLTLQKEWWEAHISEPPALTEFEKLIFHMQENLHRARYCKNPTCTTPYFFLSTKGHKGQGQEYCSSDCAVWGKREKNKLWARENREKRRK